MHPQNVFAESVLLFVTGLFLILRDRGSAIASTAYDSLLGWLLIVFAMIRMVEFLAGSRDGHIMSRTLVWLMWAIPVVIFAWLLFTRSRLDIGVLLALSVAAMIAVTLYLLGGFGGYDIITPDSDSAGRGTGVYSWIRTDGNASFLPIYYYILLAVALIYLTAFSMTDWMYWLFASVLTAAFLISALFIPQVVRDPGSTLASLTTLAMLGLGIFAILVVPS